MHTLGRTALYLLGLVAVWGVASCTRIYDAKPRDDRDWDAYGPPIYRLHAVEARSEHGVVAAATGEACRVGADILEQGGNAVDAAVATVFALAVTDPGDSGLGGMTLALVRLAGGQTVAIDGACRTPMAVDGDHIWELEEEDRRLARPEYVAAPTSLAVLARMARRFGTMPLDRLIAPAIELAEKGFTLSTFQRASIEKYLDGIRGSEDLRHMVLVNGTELPSADTVILRERFARTLRRIAARGPHDLYYGSLAGELEADLRRHGSYVTRRDLAAVHARELEPLRTSYRDTEVFAFPAPGSGASTLYILNLLERFPAEILSQDSIERVQLLIEVFRIASSDRDLVRQDPNVPQAFHDLSRLDKESAAQRVQVIRLGRATPAEEVPSRPRCHERDRETTHVAVIDRLGNAVSMTQTLGNFYGSEFMEPDLEIVYNNMLQGTCRPQPGELINSEMSPTIVVRDGQPLLAVGSAGSSRIPSIIVNIISNVVDRGMSLGEAIEAPRVMCGRTSPRLEVSFPITMRYVRQLEKMGYEEVRTVRLPTLMGRLINCGGVNAVHRDPDTGIMTGVGDPRREGAAAGAAR